MHIVQQQPVERIGLTETAKLVRSELKATFHGFKFSVTSHRYSMGCSISVRWTDGPETRRVEEVTSQFEGSSFDGSTDSRSYHNTEYRGRLVHFAAHSVHCSRRITDETAKLALTREILTAIFEPTISSWDRDDMASNIVWRQDYLAGESIIETFQRVVMS